MRQQLTMWMRRLGLACSIIVVSSFIGIASASGQTQALTTNPCDTVVAQAVMNPTKHYIKSDDFAQARITGVVVHYFELAPDGVTQAATETHSETIPKAQFALVTGTSNCYVANVDPRVLTNGIKTDGTKYVTQSQLITSDSQPSKLGPSGNPFYYQLLPPPPPPTAPENRVGL